jgi:hypothetical protein
MKKTTKSYLAIAAAAIILGITLFILEGCASKPPTAFESRLFTITTNYPTVAVVTNVVPVTIFQTNLIPVTNKFNVIEITTNVVNIPAFQTNVITITNSETSYNYAPGPGVAEIRRVGGDVGGLFGVGGLVSTALGGLFSIWAYVRSKKNYATAANIAQTVEMMREFIKGLPNGANYDAQLVQWIESNQARAGVLQSVLALLEREVSNPDARAAAQQVQLILANLQSIKPQQP